MPIERRTPRECFKTFRDHMAGVVAAVIPGYPVLACQTMKASTTGTLEFRGDVVQLETRFGYVHFYLSQRLVAEKLGHGPTYRLRTKAYQYKLFSGSGPDVDAVIRWEYESARQRYGTGYPRHHMQVGRVGAASVKVPMENGSLMDLNRVHMPSGWVTMEEIFRFLITDLDVVPPCGDHWPKVLEDSEKAFFEQFTSKRHGPPTVS